MKAMNCYGRVQFVPLVTSRMAALHARPLPMSCANVLCQNMIREHTCVRYVDILESARLRGLLSDPFCTFKFKLGTA
jgi:hypothetical protein